MSRALLPAAAALALSLGSAPAGAQSTASNIAPPAEKFAVSPGGVDMRTGRYAYSQTDMAIGGEAGGLSLARTLAQPVAGHSNPFGNFSHNWDILLSEKRVNIDQGEFRHIVGQPDYQIEIAFGGRSQTFRSYGGFTYFDQASRSGYATLKYAGGNRATGTTVYTYTTGDGTVAVFREIGSNDCSALLRCAYVAQVTEADGTQLSFAYETPGGANTTRLKSVTSNRGYALLFEYGAAFVAKACLINLAVTTLPSTCPTGAQAAASYTYSGNKLATATDAAGGTWGFSYGTNAMGFVKPGASSPWLTNTIITRTNDDGLVEEIVGYQSFADGQAYSYDFDQSPFVAGHASSIAGGTYSDAQGHLTEVRYDFPIKPHIANGQGYGNVSGEGTYDPSTPIVYQQTPGPVRIVDPLGHVTTTDYCDPNAMAGLPTSEPNRCIVMPAARMVTSPEGIRTEYIWDFHLRVVMQTRQLAKTVDGQTLDPLVRSATYNCTDANFRFCTKPVSVTDARGATANYEYYPEHGGVKTETLPPQATGAPRAQTRYQYAARKAWVSNGSGGYAQPAAPPIWVLTQTSICRWSAATGDANAPCTTPGDEVRTTYDYGPDSGPNNLWLRGQAVTADGATLRTCYGYDASGRRISQTTPRANLSACP